MLSVLAPVWLLLMATAPLRAAEPLDVVMDAESYIAVNVTRFRSQSLLKPAVEMFRKKFTPPGESSSPNFEKILQEMEFFYFIGDATDLPTTGTAGDKSDYALLIGSSAMQTAILNYLTKPGEALSDIPYDMRPRKLADGSMAAPVGSTGVVYCHEEDLKTIQAEASKPTHVARSNGGFMMVNSQANAHAVAYASSPSKRMNNLLIQFHKSLDSANKDISPLLDKVQMISGVLDGNPYAQTTVTLHLPPAETEQLYQEVIGDLLHIQRLRNAPRVPAKLRVVITTVDGIKKSNYGLELVLKFPAKAFQQKLAEFITDHLNKL